MSQPAEPVTETISDAPLNGVFSQMTHATRLRLAYAALVLVAMAVTLIAAGPALLNDPDTLWHIAVGRDIVASGVLPRSDTYSHSHFGDYWIAKEWLSQLVLYAAYGFGGFTGVSVFTAMILFVVSGQVYCAVSAYLKPILAAVITIGAMSLSADVFVARPHIVALPIMLLFVTGVWRAGEAGRAPSFWLLPIYAVWANLHASFTFGGLVALLSFGLFLMETRGFTSPAAKKWLAFLVLCPVVSMIHPYGYEAIWSTVAIAESEALPYVGEWRAFGLPDDMKVEAVLLIGAFLALVSGFRANIMAAALFCLIVHMYFTHVRFVYLLFMLTPLFFARDLARQFPPLSLGQVEKGDDGEPREAELAKAGPVLFACVATCVLLAMVFVGATVRWAPPETSFPRSAFAAAEKSGVSGNVLNEYNFGGALIFKGVPTYVDGRAERLFQNGFFERLFSSARLDGAEKLRNQIERYELGWSILRPEDGRARHLDQFDDWERVYEDQYAVVHKRIN